MPGKRGSHTLFAAGMYCRAFASMALTPGTCAGRLAEAGTVPMILSAAEFGAYVAAEAEKWSKVVKFAGLKAD